MNLEVGSDVESDHGRGTVLVITKEWLIYTAHRTGEEICLSRRHDEYWIPVTDHTLTVAAKDAAATVAVLNEAFRADPNAMHSLICNRVPCNQALADSPSVVVETSPVLRGDNYQVGMMCVLNAVLRANGLPLVAAAFSEESGPGDRATLLGFCTYDPGSGRPVGDADDNQLPEVPQQPTPPMEVTLRDAADRERDSLRLSLDMEENPAGISLCLGGYGLREMDPNAGGVIFLELYEGTARLMVWADITSPDPTHVISLAGAKESNRLQDE